MKRHSMLAGIAALGLGLTACQSEPEAAGASPSDSGSETAGEEQSNDPAASDPGGQADAPDQAADEAKAKEVRAFVGSLYRAYNSGAPISYLAKPATAFEPQLANGLNVLAARAEGSGDMPAALGADPICGCQDWDNLSHTVDSITIEGDRAVARLTVSNFGEPSARVLDLVKTPAGWRIYDIDGEFRGLVL